MPQYCVVYSRDPGFSALAEAELAALVGGHAAEPGVWISESPVRWARCAYTRIGGRQIAFGATLEALEAEVRALRLGVPRFAIDAIRVPRKTKGATEAKARIADCIDGDVDSLDPRVRFLIVVSTEGFRLLVDTEAAPDDVAWLRASHRPHNYLVALPVRIARAAVHVTAAPGESVLDPFCGSGTIPLVAAWADHESFGSDVSAACVAHSAENVAHFGQRATFTCVDARYADQSADCIVTNLPYGVYCHLEKDALRAVLQNLGSLAKRATWITSERIEEDLVREGYAIERIVSVEANRFERRVYVTRTPGA